MWCMECHFLIFIGREEPSEGPSNSTPKGNIIVYMHVNVVITCIEHFSDIERMYMYNCIHMKNVHVQCH